jgi:hypothetical protein
MNPVHVLWLAAMLSLDVNAGLADVPTTPLTLDNQVVPRTVGDFLRDPSVFNPEFYRKFYPQLKFADDAAATRDWVANGAKACRRGSFQFNARDYLSRYPDLAHGDCVAAAEHFVTAGSNEGRIGAADSYWMVFDFNYYIDPTINADLNKPYATHGWDLTDLQIHWLQHGIAERRNASAFFSVSEYQARYAAVSRDPHQAIFDYVTSGQTKGRLGRASWADPAAWNSLVQETAPPEESASANDLQRAFKSARGATVKLTVKSPAWYRADESPAWRGLNSNSICMVPPPTAADDQKNIQGFLDRLAAGSAAACRVVRLAPHAAYHIVLPANLPPNQDWVLNHRPHLRIHDAQDFVFDGNGSTVYFTGSTAGINVENAQRGIIENLTIDWGNPLDANPAWRGPLFDAYGTVRKDSATSGHIELDPATKLPPNFSPFIYTFHLWNRAGGQPAREDDLPGPTDDGCDAYCIAQKKSPTQAMRLQGLSLYPNGNASGKWVASNLVQFPDREVVVAFSRFQLNAMSLEGTGDLRIIDCTIHASPYMGITGGDRQRGISIENLSITPSQSRPFSTTADGVHLTGVRGDIILERGTFEALGDDAVNLAEVWDTVTAVASAKAFSMAGADSAAKPGDTLAFFDEALAFLGSANVASASGQLASGSGPQKIELKQGFNALRPGLKAINMMHVPSGFYVSGVTFRRKIGRGIIFGALHGLLQDSAFEDLTYSGVMFHFSSYWSEGAPSSDIAIRNNRFVRTSSSAKFYQSGTGSGTYPHRSATIAIFSEAATNFNKTPDNFIGPYPAFQDIEISGNALQSVAGAGIYMAGVLNGREPGSSEGILRNHFTACGVVAQTDPIRPYFGSASRSAVVMNFAAGIALLQNLTTVHPDCAARMDFSSSSQINL